MYVFKYNDNDFVKNNIIYYRFQEFYFFRFLHYYLHLFLLLVSLLVCAIIFICYHYYQYYYFNYYYHNLYDKATIPPFIVALTDFGLLKGLQLIAMVISVHAIESYLLYPQIYSHKLKLHPLLVLVSRIIYNHT